MSTTYTSIRCPAVAAPRAERACGNILEAPGSDAAHCIHAAESLRRQAPVRAVCDHRTGKWRPSDVANSVRLGIVSVIAAKAGSA